MRASATFRVLSALPLILFTLPALAATTPSGTAVAVIQATNVTGTGGARVLQPEAPVYTGDKVNTGAVGEAQLLFRDDTRLVVGPGSSLLIDKFVFTDEDTAKSVTINAVRGTFRFITGSSPKNAYVIRTPTATIGLRGTRFDFTIGTRGETRLALYEGGLRFCDRKGNCVDLSGRCEIVSAAPNQGIERVANSQKDSVLKANFPYFNNQNGLRGDFRIDRGSCTAQPSTPSARPLPAPPPEKPDDCGHDNYKHHHHAKFDREGRFDRNGKWSNGDKGQIDDAGFRPARDAGWKGKPGNTNGNSRDGAPGNNGQNVGKSDGGSQSNSSRGPGDGGFNKNRSGDGGTGRGGRGFSWGR